MLHIVGAVRNTLRQAAYLICCCWFATLRKEETLGSTGKTLPLLLQIGVQYLVLLYSVLLHICRITPFATTVFYTTERGPVDGRCEYRLHVQLGPSMLLFPPTPAPPP